MGGPLWTKPEEDFFWEEIVPKSDKRLGYTKDQKSQIKSWEQLAVTMRKAMATKFEELGKEVPRKYTALTLAEHWDKNVMQDRVSKAAKEHVAEYVAQMEATDAERWARREKRLSNLAGGADDDDDDDDDDADQPKKKRRRTSGVSTIAPMPSTGAKGGPVPTGSLHKNPRKRPATDYYKDEDDAEQDHTPPAGGPSTELRSVGLPSIRNISRDWLAPGPYTTRRQLFHPGSGRNNLPSGAFGHRANPRPFPVNDNPFYQPPQAQPSGPSVETIVREVQERMRPTVDRLREEVGRGIGDMVRDEVARQLGLGNHYPTAAPSMSRPDVERPGPANVLRGPYSYHHHADNSLMLGQARILSPAPPQQQQQEQQQQQQQQQQFSAVGRGGPYASRPAPTGQFSLSPRGGAARTPLPTAPGQFPMSHVRSRVRGLGRRAEGADEDEDGEEEEKDHRA